MALAINVTFSGATAADTRAYKKMRNVWNADHPDAQVATPAALCEAILLEQVDDWKKKELQDSLTGDIQNAWKDATDETRAQIVALLGLN